MLALIPKKLEFESSLSAKEFLEKVNRCLYYPKETGLFKIGNFTRNHFSEDLFYGSRRENAFTVFHHSPKKRDGGGVRFNGVVIDTENGCKVAGYIRHSIWAYLFSLAWLLVTFMITVVVLVESPKYTLVSLVFMLLGGYLALRDCGNSKRLREFLENLCEN